MPVRAIFIDLFDTLVDMHMDRLPVVEIGGRRIPSTYGLLHAASVQWHALEFEDFAAALGKCDRELRETYYGAGRELPTLERFLEFGRRIGHPEETKAAALTAAHMNEIRKHVTPIAHHAEVLERLRVRASLAVCSNFSHSATARAVLADAGLLPFFDEIVISDEVGIRKPRPEIFRAALSRVGVAPEEAIHVGDDLAADVEGAARLGLGTVWLTRRVRDPGEALRKHTGARPGHVISDLAGLEPILAAASAA